VSKKVRVVAGQNFQWIEGITTINSPRKNVFSEVRFRRKPCDIFIVQPETHDKVIAWFFHYKLRWAE
jgi:hypothetical protein